VVEPQVRVVEPQVRVVEPQVRVVEPQVRVVEPQVRVVEPVETTNRHQGQSAVLIMPAPMVTPVVSSMRMKEPVARFLE
jgi:hypothetical protein